jgi:hypothetical protein
MHNISNLFYFGTTLYMFRTERLSVISSLRLYTQHQVYVIQVLWPLASENEMELVKQAATGPVWHIPDAVCTVLDSWWWMERPFETCRVLFQNKINLRYSASGWFYYRNILLQKNEVLCTFLHKFVSVISKYLPGQKNVPNKSCRNNEGWDPTTIFFYFFEVLRFSRYLSKRERMHQNCAIPTC